MVERKMRGDADEPAARTLVGANPREVPPGAQKRLLRKIVGSLLVAGHAPQIVEDVVLVRAEEGLELADLSLRERAPHRGHCGRRPSR